MKTIEFLPANEAHRLITDIELVSVEAVSSTELDSFVDNDANCRIDETNVQILLPDGFAGLHFVSFT